MRNTNMANAFLRATIKQVDLGKVDHQRGTGNWVARRVAIKAEQGHIPRVSDNPPHNEEARKLHSGELQAKGLVLDDSTKRIIEEEIFHVCDKLVAGRKAMLMDEESLGVD